jgi:hypothetical protein
MLIEKYRGKLYRRTRNEETSGEINTEIEIARGKY